MSLKGGEKLLSRLRAMLRTESAGVRVGFLEGATYPDGTSVAYIAAINEYGKPDAKPPQPARPFFRNAIAEHQKDWPKKLGKIMTSVNYDQEKALGLMGQLIKGQVQTSITKLQTPGLAESTKKRKKFDNPLIETNHMRNSVDYEVNL